MGAFLEQYGIAIFVLVIIGIMVLMASGIGGEVERLLLKKVTEFETMGNTEMSGAMNGSHSFNTGI